MSIYFTGANGQGKTTTAKLLSSMLEEYNNCFYPVIDGLSRRSPFKFGTNNHQQWLSSQVYRTCMTVEGIHCRTPLDVAAHTQAYEAYSPCDGQHINIFANTSPVIIYFPLWLKPKDDGVRVTEEKINRDVDHAIKDFLWDNEIAHLELSPATPSERVGVIFRYLEDVGYELPVQEQFW